VSNLQVATEDGWSQFAESFGQWDQLLQVLDGPVTEASCRNDIATGSFLIRKVITGKFVNADIQMTFVGFMLA
jgi:hypothetical protein